MKSSRFRSDDSRSPPAGVNSVNANPSTFRVLANCLATGHATFSRNAS